jgi:SAM-dependent MidA family methyltransferase
MFLPLDDDLGAEAYSHADGLDAFLATASRTLDAGFVLTIDYGYDDRTLASLGVALAAFAAAPPGGADAAGGRGGGGGGDDEARAPRAILRAYSRDGRCRAAPFACPPGVADLTADVDFSEARGESGGIDIVAVRGVGGASEQR